MKLAFAGRRRKSAVRKRRIACRKIEALPALFLDALPVVVRRDATLGKGLCGDGVVAVGKAGLAIAHACRETPEDFGVRQRLAERFDRGLIRDHVKMTVRPMHVDVLEL